MKSSFTMGETPKPPLRALALALGLSAALALPAVDARADDGKPQARVLFEAGALAYKRGEYQTAIVAFEQAYKVEARPRLLFSIAQAQKRQYAKDWNPARAVEALRLYREYLASGDDLRKDEAQEAVTQLQPIVQKLEQSGVVKPGPLPAETGTRLVVSCPVEGASLYLDGETKPRAVSQVVQLSPGKHVVRVRADGYVEERREIEIAAGAVTALDLPLRELPARIAPKGPRGAEITVDARPVGIVPVTAPIDVAPGRHVVRFMATGHEDYEEQVDVSRGATKDVVAAMPRTKQRKAAWGLIVAGGATAVAGVALGIASAAQQASATSLKADIDQGTSTCPGSGCSKLTNYNNAIDDRDRLRTVAGVLGAVGGVATAGGVLLYFFDEPTRRRLAPTDEGPATPRAPAGPTEIVASPMLAPGLYGARLGVRF